jgi:hypothetical protein
MPGTCWLVRTDAGCAGHCWILAAALAVGGARTMLAGWDPDQTYWLTDILTLAGSAVTWLKTDAGWIPA